MTQTGDPPAEDGDEKDSGDSESESMALELICAAVNGTWFKRTGGDSAKADGVIALSDGSELEVEVARDASERFMKGAQAVDQFEGPIKLAAGSGSWVALFESGTRLKGLHTKGQALIDDVMASSRLRSPDLPVALDYSFDGLHVAIIQYMGDAPDQLVFGVQEVSNTEGSFIDTSPDAIGRYAQAYVNGAGSRRSSRHRMAKFDHLASRARGNGRLAHFALVADSASDTGVRFSLSRMSLTADWDYDLPRDDLALPRGVDGFWVVSPDYSAAVAYLKDHGWLRHPN